MKASGEDRDAVHLAFDQDGVVQFPNRFFYLVEIEQYLRLGIDRGLRRVQILGARLFVGREGAPGKADDASRLVGDGEHDAVAKLGIDRSGRWPLRFAQGRLKTVVGRWLPPFTVVISSGVEGPCVLLRADG